MRYTGKVVDQSTNEPLPLANVFPSDADGKPTSTTGDSTDFDGNFQFDTGSQVQYVSATSVGFKTETKPAQPEVNFQLAPQTYQIGEFEVKAVSTATLLAYIAGGVLVVGLGALAYQKFKG
jgi:hypothetical protein